MTDINKYNYTIAIPDAIGTVGVLALVAAGVLGIINTTADNADMKLWIWILITVFAGCLLVKGAVKGMAVRPIHYTDA